MLIFTESKYIEKIACFLLGKSAQCSSLHIAQATEAQLKKMSPADWCVSQEDNLAILAQLKNKKWSRAIDQVVRRWGVDADKLDRLMSQRFTMHMSRRISLLRLCLRQYKETPIVLSDLPADVVRCLVERGELKPLTRWQRLASVLLRGAQRMQSKCQLAVRHLARMAKLLSLCKLPKRQSIDTQKIAAAWIMPAPSDVAEVGREKHSLVEYLAEMVEHSALDTFVIQGFEKKDVVSSIVGRQYLPPVRFRPALRVVLSALLAQLRLLLRDLVEVDCRVLALQSERLLDLPSFVCWFQTDLPRAIFYSNATIGSEPAAALLAPRFSVPTVMVYYSVNITHRCDRQASVHLNHALEPEQRYIIADYLTMWSDAMRDVYRAAGYAASRLLDTGPIVFARQKVFQPKQRVAGQPLKIGVFDVTPFKPFVRFQHGFGELIYNPRYTADFFRGLIETAGALFQDQFVLVRKMKRTLSDNQIDVFRAVVSDRVQIESRDPVESIWSVLSDVDCVVCMPFTSVAFLAAEYGIPAAYYDPSGSLADSPLAGQAVLLRGEAALHDWLSQQKRPSVSRNADVLTGVTMLEGVMYA